MFLCLLDGFDDILVEPFVPDRAVVALDVGVLLGLTGLDVLDRDAQFLSLSDVSAHGTVLRDCVVEGLRFIFTPIGVEDDEDTRDDEGACRAGG